MFGRIGPMELILILVIALVIFGPKKLPEIGKAIGDAFKAFKKTQEDATKEVEKLVSDKPETPAGGTASKEPDQNEKSKS